MDTPVSALRMEACTALSPSTPVADALLVLAETGQVAVPVVDNDHFYGLAKFVDLNSVPEPDRRNVPVFSVAHAAVAVVTTETTAEEALRVMDKAGTSVAAVVSSGAPVRFVGLVTRGGILHVLPPAEG